MSLNEGAADFDKCLLTLFFSLIYLAFIELRFMFKGRELMIFYPFIKKKIAKVS